MKTPTLEDTRREAADAAFEAHNFGDFLVPTDTDGWTIDGIYWSRWVYGDDLESKDRFRVSFGVEFAPDSAKVIETWVQK